MCFYKTSCADLAKKATYDIYVFKQLVREDGELFSPVRRSKWKNNKKRTSKFVTNLGGMAVRHGIHSYKTVHAGVNSYSSRDVLFLAKIPRGAMYYENNHQFCSNSLVLVHEIKLPKKKIHG